MRSLKDLRLSLPAILTLISGASLTVCFVVIALILHGPPLGVLLVAGVGVAATAISLYIGSRFTKHFIGTNWRITTEYDDEDDPDGGIASDQGGRGA